MTHRVPPRGGGSTVRRARTAGAHGGSTVRRARTAGAHAPCGTRPVLYPRPLRLALALLRAAG
ncbi:hypothetical protein, partial [Streptomyces sp. SID3915]|uniref:hypothetical protein n=1 Tax=Streptomyces sp. SID3915 TaxID=2690263 RepID=UPI001F223836